MNKVKFLPYILATVFLVASLVTLDDYGINWDEPVHFMRGQAYWRYFLTGKKDYQGMPKLGFHYPKNDRVILSEKPDFEDDRQFRRSVYQNDIINAEYFFKNDAGHPPLSDILAAATNWLFYQKLGALGDIEAHHFFEALTGAVLVLVVALFAQETYGNFAGLISGLSLFLYPLFWAESHFNIKDPVEACFFGLTIYSFYKAIKHKSAKWMIFSSIFCGMALGTKLNIVFVPLIILPWLATVGIQKRLSKNLLISMFLYPFIVFAIFFLFWPYLWQDPKNHFLETIQYYRGIGMQQNFQPPNFYIHGFNTYPLQAIIFTTPLVILFFTLIGIVACFFLFRKEKEKTSFLWLLWLIIPIARVTIPGTTIYGGVRQIMEYIPAMALLSGLGAKYFVNVLVQFSARRELKFAIPILVILMFLPIALKMIQMHPNQGLYLNPLIGGLKGAKERNFPNWGLSLGNEYRQGVKWINQNTPRGAKLVLAAGYEDNLPRIWLRRDIKYLNTFRSGINSEGEYVIGMTHDVGLTLFYLSYVKRFLKPLYEVKVDDVAILRIWKNDWEHRNPEYQAKEEVLEIGQFQQDEESILIDLEKEVFLTKIDIESDDLLCRFSKEEYFLTSKKQENWVLHPSVLEAREFFPGFNSEEKNNKLSYFFAGEKTRFIKVIYSPGDSCFKNIKKISVRKLKNE